MDNLGGTAYKVGDEVVWACQSRAKQCGGPLGATRGGVIASLEPMLPMGQCGAFGRRGKFWCGTCRRQSETIYPPDADGAKAREDARKQALE